MRLSNNQVNRTYAVASHRLHLKVSWLLVAIGTVVSAYLTIVHFEHQVSLVCPDSGIINCEQVTTSPQSYFLGIPVAVLGLGFYIAQAAILTFLNRYQWLYNLRLVLLAAGVVFVLYLVYSELVVIGAICLWCTTVHVVTLLYFLLAFYDFIQNRSGAS
jgi:uncharacterized membrane protein